MSIWPRALLFIVIMPGAVAGWLPWYIARDSHVGERGVVQIVAGMLFVGGWAVLFWCTRDFVRRGRGTPAPYDPPRALVTSGLFSVVRNSMYVGVVAAIAGVALWYRSGATAIYGACVALAFHLRVVLYEEPRLTGGFGPSYEAYRRAVPRWIPILRRRLSQPIQQRQPRPPR